MSITLSEAIALEEKKKKSLSQILSEKSKEEDFIPIEETDIKLSPISDAAKELEQEEKKEKDFIPQPKKTFTLSEAIAKEKPLEGSVLDGKSIVDAEKIIEDNGYYSIENFYENLIKRTYGGAIRDLAQGTLDFTDYLGDKFFDEKPFENVKIPTVAEPTYFGGQFARDITGFAIPYFGVSKVAGLINTVTKIPKATTFAGSAFRATLKGEVAAQFAFSPYESRLSNLVQAFPTLANPITEYLQANDKDSEDKARLKMAIEGGIIGVTFDKLLGFVQRGKNYKVETNIIKNNDTPVKKLNEVRKARNKVIEKETGTTAKSFEDKVNLQSKDVYDDISENIISQRTQKKITKFFDELLSTNQLERNTNIRISQQMYDVLTTPRIMMKKGSESIDALLKKNKLQPKDLADYFVAGARTSAQNLNRLSQLAKVYGKFLDDGKVTKKMRKEFEAQGIDSELLINDTLKRLDGVRRASMVSRWSTAMRNFISQQARVGLNVFYEGFQYGSDRLWEKLSGKKLQRQTNPITAFQGFLNTWKSANILNWSKTGTRQRIKRDVDNILKFYPKEQDRMFLRYSSDILNKTGFKGYSPLNLTEKAANLLNFLNRFQEFITRRSVFYSTLDGIVRGRKDIYKGKNLADLVSDNNLIKTIRKEDISTAIDLALDMTYARQPKRGSIGEKFTKLINSLPFITTLVIPFPRFLANSLKFLYEYSPLPTFVGAARVAADPAKALLTFSTDGLYTKAIMKKLKEGDTTGFTKAIVGWGLMGTAFQIRDSRFAGEKWNEIKVGDRRLDLLPYNPLAAYLYVADLVNRKQNGTLTSQTFNFKEFAKVFAGTRGGTGLYLVDSLINIASAEGTNKQFKFVNELVGQIASQYFTGFKTYMSFLDAADGNIQAAKDTKTSSLENANLSGSGVSIVNNLKSIFNPAELPDRTSITHAVFDEKSGKYVARPVRNDNPVLTELTGLTIRQPKNAAEIELDKLNFTYKEIFKSTGIPVLDRAYKNIFAPLIHVGLSGIVESDGYKNLSISQKRLVIKTFITEAKKDTMKALQQDSSLVSYIMEYQLSKISKSQRKVIDEAIGKDFLNQMILEYQKLPTQKK